MTYTDRLYDLQRAAVRSHRRHMIRRAVGGYLAVFAAGAAFLALFYALNSAIEYFLP